MKHDESNDVRLLSKFAKINSSSKTISIPENAIIGNKRWGRLDFLTHYCGYHLVRPSGVIINNSSSIEKERKRKDKQDKRDNKSNNRKQNKFVRK